MFEGNLQQCIVGGKEKVKTSTINDNKNKNDNNNNSNNINKRKRKKKKNYTGRWQRGNGFGSRKSILINFTLSFANVEIFPLLMSK